jgi:parallel beta-helix repeat protein
MRQKRSSILWTVSALAVVFCLLSAHGASAQVSCGDTITVGTLLVATDPVTSGPCGTSPALTVTGPATLDLNGFTVSCATAATDGIVIDGQGAKVKNGLVEGCDTGFLLTGSGLHSLNKLMARSNANGFRGVSSTNKLSDCIADSNTTVAFTFSDASNGNNLLRNTAINNAGEGFNFQGSSSNHKITECVASGNGGIGFHMFGGSGQKFSKSAAIENDDHGFLVLSSNTTFTKNVAARNVGSGFIFQGADVKFVKNTATGNDASGVFLGNTGGTTGAKVLKNTLTSNGTSGIGLGTSTQDSLIASNLSMGNALYGIRLHPTNTASNTIKRNVALGNGTDLWDDTACVAAAWSKNVFLTSTDPCLQ